MLRKDREIKDIDEIIDVLKRCDTLSIGFMGDKYPYVVPVSFGVVCSGNSVAIYFHGAMRGQKIDMLEQNPKVCVEGHIFHKVEITQHGITTRYESVIGFGSVEKVDGDEIAVGLGCITAHYGYSEYPLERCKGLAVTAVYKITIEHLSGKRNLPG